MNERRKPRHRISHEDRLTWLTIGAVAPAALIALSLLWFGEYSAKVQWTLTLVISGFTFGPERKLRLVNRAGENLLKRPMDKLLGRSARELRLDVCLEANEDAPLTLAFPGATGRWGVRRSTFREHGLPYELLVLTDLSRTLRVEERIAW